MTMTTNTTTRPAIWVGCLAAYNSGTLHGEWIAIDELCGVEDLQDRVNMIIKTSPIPGEDWAIMDYEGFNNIHIEEYGPLEYIIECVQNMSKHGPAWSAYVGDAGTQYATIEDFEGRYIGEYDTKLDFAYEWSENCGLFEGQSSQMERYFDWDSYTYALFLQNFTDIKSDHHTVYVFHQ